MKTANFTLRWESPEGFVSFLPATAISVLPFNEESLPPKERAKYPAKLEYSHPDDDDIRCSIDRGSVFIMNERAKTVGVVHLGMSPPQAA